jgi:homoaconitate hydratase
VNARVDDLESAARELRGRRVAPGVELYVSAASANVERDARVRGAWDVLLAAGAIALPPGCGPCIGLGRGTLRAGETGISATNRNYPGRMGDASASCWIASPAVVAASAAAGVITAPAFDAARAGGGRVVEVRLAAVPDASPPPADAATFQGAKDPALAPIRGPVTCLPRDGITTDAIWPSTLTYLDDVSGEEMAQHVLRNFDPTFATIARRGDVLVAGWSFGSGSSREQAVTALAAFGIRAVVAASIARTFRRNALNQGFPVIECPALVEWLRESESVSPAALVVRPEHALTIDWERAALHVEAERGDSNRPGETIRSFPIAPLSRVERRLLSHGGLGPLVREAIATGGALA